MSEFGTGKAESRAALAVAAAALGYFVDVYDIWLYAVLRKTSLISLGITDPKQIQAVGEWLLNWQMAGFMIGAVGFGVLSDKKGRLAVLFGSILTYSLANIANGFVQDVNAYAVCRLVAGMGLAGELGAGIALVSELIPPKKRGWATTLVAFTGVAGSVAAAVMGSKFDWRISYFIGGGMGLALLLLRLGVLESSMFEKTSKVEVARGRILDLFKTKERFTRYLAAILAGGPVWFFAGMFMTFGPELQTALGVQAPKEAPAIVLMGAVGLTLGDLLFGGLSQLIKSRKKAMMAAFAVLTIGMGVILAFARTGEAFVWLTFAAGLGAGYWAVYVTTAGEVFGTNLRGTVAITAPSFVRGLVIPLTMARTMMTPALGLVTATVILGVGSILAAVWAVNHLPETYGTDLDYLET